jgi:hypothetical protein
MFLEIILSTVSQISTPTNLKLMTLTLFLFAIGFTIKKYK